MGAQTRTSRSVGFHGAGKTPYRVSDKADTPLWQTLGSFRIAIWGWCWQRHRQGL